MKKQRQTDVREFVQKTVDLRPANSKPMPSSKRLPTSPLQHPNAKQPDRRPTPENTLESAPMSDSEAAQSSNHESDEDSDFEPGTLSNSNNKTAPAARKSRSKKKGNGRGKKKKNGRKY